MLFLELHLAFGHRHGSKPGLFNRKANKNEWIRRSFIWWFYFISKIFWMWTMNGDIRYTRCTLHTMHHHRNNNKPAQNNNQSNSATAKHMRVMLLVILYYYPLQKRNKTHHIRSSNCDAFNVLILRIVNNSTTCTKFSIAYVWIWNLSSMHSLCVCFKTLSYFALQKMQQKIK